MKLRTKMYKVSISTIVLCILILVFPFSFPISSDSSLPNEISFKDHLNSASDPNAFISEWNTYLNEIHLPLVSNGTYNFFVDWGDNSNDTITSWNQPETNHTYSSSGTYIINITGEINGWSFNNQGHKNSIIEIHQ